MKKITRMSDHGIQFLIREEGLVTKAYADAVGIPTIGVGMTYYPDSGRKVQLTDPELTVEQALKYLRNILESYEAAVYRLTRNDINQNQFDALTSITYNIGVAGFKSSSLLRKVNTDVNDPEIEKAFLAYRYATTNGMKKPILLGRRKREADLYFSRNAPLPAPQSALSINQLKSAQSKLDLIPDGIYGTRTRSALIEFQNAKGLVPDGILGPKTLTELNLL